MGEDRRADRVGVVVAVRGGRHPGSSFVEHHLMLQRVAAGRAQLTLRALEHQALHAGADGLRAHRLPVARPAVQDCARAADPLTSSRIAIRDRASPMSPRSTGSPTD